MPLSRRVVKIGQRTYYELSKTALQQMLECFLKHFLIRWFRKDVPSNKYLLAGKIVHKVAEQLWDGTKWESPESFAGRAVWMWNDVLTEETDTPGGREIVGRRADKALVLKKEPATREGEIIILYNPRADYFWGLNKVRRCTLNFATRLWGKPRPLQETSFKIVHDGVFINGKIDLMFKQDPRDGFWYIGELKTTTEPRTKPENTAAQVTYTGKPLPTDWEPPIYIVAWGHLVAEDDNVARYLGVPPAIRAELTKNPQAAFKYVRMVYFLLDRDPEVKPGGELERHEYDALRWQEFAGMAWWAQGEAIKAESTGEIMLNRFHCARCEVRAICDEYLYERHHLTFKPPTVNDQGLVMGPSRRGPAGEVMELNLQYGNRTARKPLISSRKRRFKVKNPLGESGGA